MTLYSGNSLPNNVIKILKTMGDAEISKIDIEVQEIFAVEVQDSQKLSGGLYILGPPDDGSESDKFYSEKMRVFAATHLPRPQGIFQFYLFLSSIDVL